MRPFVRVLAAFLAIWCHGQAQDTQAASAADVMKKVGAVYSKVSSIHVVAKRDEVLSRAGQSAVSSADYEIAAKGKRYFVRFKLNGQDATAISDGESTWKAFAPKKQWTRLAAASMSNEDEDDDGSAGPADLFTFVSRPLFAQFPAIAKFAENPEIVKDVEIKVGKEKIACHVIRLRAGKVDHELWVDKRRFVVWEHRQKSILPTGAFEAKLRVASIEINQEIPDSRFQFEPGKGWSEVETMLLPGEDRLDLTGSRAPSFNLKTVEGESVAFDQTRGKVVLLNFWATWCPPCRKEFPGIERLVAEYGDRVHFYGVSAEETRVVRDFLKKNEYRLPVMIDGKRQVHRQYLISAIPTILVIDKQGVIREHFIGSRDEATLRKAIQAAIAANSITAAHAAAAGPPGQVDA